MLNGIHNAVIIHNPLAGGNRRARARRLNVARRILAESGIEAEVRETTVSGDGTALARRAVEQGRQLVIACGGDGTLNEVVNGLAGSQVPLAILPAGTANVLAKEMSIPWNIPHAAKLITRGTLRRIALGAVIPLPERGPRRYFLSVAGAGPDGVLVYALSLGLKLRVGVWAYWLEGFRQLFRYKFPRFRVTTTQRSMEASLVIVGRTKHYGGPFCITTEADLFGNEFEVAVYSSRSALRFLSHLPAVWLGRHRRMADIYFAKTTSLRCEPLESERVYAQVDGEPVGRLPVEFIIVPDALTLVVPESVTRGS